jgi:hypothetical protein
MNINGIDCYGAMSECATIEVKCDDECHDHLNTDGYPNWQAAVAAILAYAKPRGMDVVELESDE